MTDNFSALGVASDLVATLKERGIHSPSPIQLITIPDALAGRDVCGKAKTGSGKTLAFGIPMVERLSNAGSSKNGSGQVRSSNSSSGSTRGLILVPARELALQVAKELRPLAERRKLRLAPLYGGEPIEAQVSKIQAGLDIIVATPGRLIDLIDRKALFVSELKFVVVDEADRMADMGFLPQVEWILRHVESRHQTLLFSATLDAAVDALVRRYQTKPVRHEVQSRQVTVDEMQHRFVAVHQMDKLKVAATIIAASNRTLVFCATRYGCDRLSRDLKSLGVRAEPIHGDLRQNIRERSLARFMLGKIQALVATDVAARGLHIDDVDVVVHYDPAPDYKTYLHRSGRTARAGETGMAVTLSLWNQELEVKRLQRRLALDMPIVEMFSNDERLVALDRWDPVAQPV
ncbi:MAG: DEAD/DEAH box helicase [Acidimicrobiia bacterium]|nr:DEAD/DEAH box helicase [Acidimicrobiia bacterium]MYC58183.1 DEAD/DEAH box helicase [Acidimicrobiia bacterium]MYI30615.1 DEAD/DEAH box helicase [Acidimicrobiia bacterium]